MAPAPAVMMRREGGIDLRSLVGTSRGTICIPKARAAASLDARLKSSIVRVSEHARRWPWAKLTQQFQPLCREHVAAEKVTPVRLPPGRLRLATRPSLTGSSPATKTMGMVVVGGSCRITAGVLPTITALAGGSVRRPGRKPIRAGFRPAVLDRDVPALDKAFLTSGPGGTRQKCAIGAAGVLREKSDHRHRRLLRARREWPRRRRAAEQRDELAPSHSITSSARPSSGSGTVRPNALAVLRLMISSTFVDCWTGRSPGFSPLRIRPV